MKEDEKKEKLEKDDEYKEGEWEITFLPTYEKPAKKDSEGE